MPSFHHANGFEYYQIDLIECESLNCSLPSAIHTCAVAFVKCFLIRLHMHNVCLSSLAGEHRQEGLFC